MRRRVGRTFRDALPLPEALLPLMHGAVAHYLEAKGSEVATVREKLVRFLQEEAPPPPPPTDEHLLQGATAALPTDEQAGASVGNGTAFLTTVAAMVEELAQQVQPLLHAEEQADAEHGPKMQAAEALRSEAARLAPLLRTRVLREGLGSCAALHVDDLLRKPAAPKSATYKAAATMWAESNYIFALASYDDVVAADFQVEATSNRLNQAIAYRAFLKRCSPLPPDAPAAAASATAASDPQRTGGRATHRWPSRAEDEKANNQSREEMSEAAAAADTRGDGIDLAAP